MASTQQDFDIDEVVVQKKELSEAKWASLEEIDELIAKGKFADNVIFTLEEL